MCQNSHFAHKLTPYHPKNTFLSIFLPCKKCPRYVTPCFHWPWIFEICWCIMESPDPPLHSLPHRCLHYWTGPGKLNSAGKSLILLPVIPFLVFLHHSWHTNCPLLRPALLLLLWTTEGSVWNTSVGHRTLHMNQKMKQTLIQDKQELVVPLTIYI